MTVGYVGSEGHRLLTQIESNPGNQALCLSLRGTGVMAGTAQCGPNGENGTYTRPDGTQVFGTRGPFGNDFTSNSYQMNLGNSAVQLAPGHTGAKSRRLHVCSRVHLFQIHG